MGPRRYQTALTFQLCVSTDAIMATLPTKSAVELGSDLNDMPYNVAHAVFPWQVVQAQNTWQIWCTFWNSINVDPGLGQFQYPFHADGEMVDWHPKGSQSMLVQQRMQYMQWTRRFPNWGPLSQDQRSQGRWICSSLK
jgi:hypothetical protein